MMISLEDLQKMAKEGRISEKILADEDLKSEFKRILKEEDGIEVTDEQIPEIIKNFEIALQDKKIVDEAKLDDVSGGGAIGRIAVRAVCVGVGTVVGKEIGTGFSAVTNRYSVNPYTRERTKQMFEDFHSKDQERVNQAHKDYDSMTWGGSTIGGLGGMVAGWRAATYLIKKLKL